MTTRQRLVVLSGALLTLIIAGGMAAFFKASKEKMILPKPTQIVRKVESAIVKYSKIETDITGTGRVLSRQSVDVISEVQGRLLAGDISLKKGAGFTKGQLLIKVYDAEAVYNMKSRKSSFLNSLANILPDLKIDYSENYQKWVDFFESVNIEDDLPALPDISSSQEKIFLAGKGILRDYYSIKSDEERLKKYNIRAPFSGAVQEVMLEAGSVANPGSRIAKIIQTGKLEIEVPLQIAEARWVGKGQKAELKSEDGHTIGTGIVKREAAFVDPKSQSINVYVAVLPESERLYAGQYLKVAFSGMIIQDAMEIPRNAIFNGNQVFIVDSGYLAKKEINILKTNEKTIIFSGLEEGVELVMQPLANANTNMAVQSDFSNVHKVVVDSTKPEDITERQEKE